MGVHSYHEAAPNFSEAQILHDGCGECERRGRDISMAVQNMDKGRFALAWARAAQWNRRGLPDVSEAEAPLLSALWAIQIKLETVCGLPVGELPA